MSRIIILLMVLIIGRSGYSQNVGIGTSQPHPSALLDLQSANKGVLIPRVTSTQRNSIAAPAAGLLVFDIDKRSIYMFDGSQWLPLAFSSNSPVAMNVTADNLVPDARFGSSVGISANYAVISALPVGSDVVGSAYIFVKSESTWTLQAKLLPSDGASAFGFGAAVAISGDHVLIGAPRRNSLRGAVYAFARNGNLWTQTQIITPMAEQAGSLFGGVISFKGLYALFGVQNYKNAPDQICGTVYAFYRNINGWQQTQQLLGDATKEGFGTSIDMSGSYAIVGAPLAEVAYLYKRTGNTWNPVDTIHSKLLNHVYRFGSAVALYETDGLWVFVTEANRTLNSSGHEGVVQVFRLTPTGLEFVSYISPNTSAEHGRETSFGASLCVYGNYLAIGSPGVSNHDAGPGRVYIYKYDKSAPDWTKWHFSKVLKDNSAMMGDHMYNNIGYEVFISGFDIIIGNRGFNNAKGKVLFANIE